MSRLVRWRAVGLASLSLSLSLLGCGVLIPLRARDDLQAAARAVAEASCTDESRAAGAEIASPRLVRSVEPLYVYTHSRSNVETRRVGATVHLAPRPGFTPEWLTSVLRCHGALGVLEAHSAPSPAASPDPYFLPDAWVQIDVTSESDGFVARLKTDTPSDGARVYERALRFVAAPRPQP